MTESDEERRYRKRKDKQREMERQQGETERRSSSQADRFPGTNGEYKKTRAKIHNVGPSDIFVSEQAQTSTRQYQRDNREADRLDRIREKERAEEVSRLGQRSERRHERKGGLDRQGHDRLADRTQDIAGLDVGAASARRDALFNSNDRKNESYNLQDMSSRNLHGRHARTAEEEARRSMRMGGEHAEYAHEPSTPSSRDRYPHIAGQGERNRVALPPPSRDGRDHHEGRTHHSSPLAVDAQAVSSLSSSSRHGPPRVNPGPPPPSDFRPYVPESQRPSTSASTSMTGGSGQRHQRNPLSWAPSRGNDVAGLAMSVAGMSTHDSDEDRDRRRRRGGGGGGGSGERRS